MDKTYAETQGEKPFDWNKFLDRAIAGEVDEGEHRTAVRHAWEWVTCACGNQCAIIPRADREIIDLTATHCIRGKGSPMDDQLYRLGCKFPEALECHHFQTAKEILSEIEARSKELIAVELAKLNHAR